MGLRIVPLTHPRTGWARLQAVFRGLADAADEQSSIRTLASFVVESGRPNLNRE